MIAKSVNVRGSDLFVFLSSISKNRRVFIHLWKKNIYIRKINSPHCLAEVKASKLIMTKSSIVEKSAEQEKELDVKSLVQMKRNNVREVQSYFDRYIINGILSFQPFLTFHYQTQAYLQRLCVKWTDAGGDNRFWFSPSHDSSVNKKTERWPLRTKHVGRVSI